MVSRERLECRRLALQGIERHALRCNGAGRLLRQANKFFFAGLGAFECRAVGGLCGRGLGRGLGNSLSNLAYQSSEAEAGRQAAAIAGAPQMAQSDYFDIQALLKAGQGGEQYQQAALQDAMNRFNYEQNLPGQKLQQFTNLFSQAPAGTTSTTTQSGGK